MNVPQCGRKKNTKDAVNASSLTKVHGLLGLGFSLLLA